MSQFAGPGDSPVGKGIVSVLQEKNLRSQAGSGAGEVLSPAGQSLWPPVPRGSSVAWSSPLVCGARLSQQWSGACLSDTLTVVDSTV